MNNSAPINEKDNLPQKSSFRFSVVMKNYSSISIFCYLFYSAIFIALNLWYMVLICGLNAILWTAIHFINRRGGDHICFMAGITGTTLFSVLGTFLLGWDSGFFFSALLIIPLIFFDTRLKKGAKITFAAVVCCVLLFVFVYTWGHSPYWILPQGTLRWLYAANLVFTVVILSITGHFFESAASDAEHALITVNKRLTGLAATDPVTNLVNRRTMMASIEHEKERMERGGKTFVLIMVDIDNFKQVNDEYGHDGGDFILVNLANIINLTLRKQDEVARWGGDEFLILLPETDLEGGRIVAEKIRSQIIRSPFVYNEIDIPVTVTFGVGICDYSTGIGNCIRKADQALYLGKQAGKNRVEIMK